MRSSDEFYQTFPCQFLIADSNMVIEVARDDEGLIVSLPLVNAAVQIDPELLAWASVNPDQL